MSVEQYAKTNIPVPKNNTLTVILWNALAPIFAATSAFSLSTLVVYLTSDSPVVTLHNGLSIHNSVLTVTWIAFLLVNFAAGVLTVVHLFSDDTMVAIGRLVMQPQINKLKNENYTLKKQIEALKATKYTSARSTETHMNDEFTTEQESLVNAVMLIHENLLQGTNIDRRSLTPKHMSQVMWTNARKMMIRLNIMKEDNTLRFVDSEYVRELVISDLLETS